jgi:ABC-type uncharacterized transport system permease subunit
VFSEIANIISLTLMAAAPLIFAALGATFSERSGVVNIGVEGMMITGAFAAIWGSYQFNSPWIGLLMAIIAGILIALIHAVLSISFNADQVISGTAINIMAMALTSYLTIQIWNQPGQTPMVGKINQLNIPILKQIPFIKDVIGYWTIFVYAAIILVFVSDYIIFKTPFGLRIRAVGENPRAADTLGINVYFIRYTCVLISGALAGIGGASLSIGSLGMFRDGMTSGRGFIAIAAMIFGKWNPKGAFYGCLLFGFADAMQIFGQTISFLKGVPTEFFSAFPYVITMIALAGLIGKSRAPMADGVPYEK